MDEPAFYANDTFYDEGEVTLKFNKGFSESKGYQAKPHISLAAKLVKLSHHRAPPNVESHHNFKSRSRSHNKYFAGKPNHLITLEDRLNDTFYHDFTAHHDDQEMEDMLDKLAYNEVSESLVVSELRRCHPLFRRLSYKGASMIFRQGSFVRLRNGQTICHEGEDECACIVLSGRIVVYTECGDVLGVVSSGESVGEEVFVLPQRSYRLFATNTRQETNVSDGTTYLLSIDCSSMQQLKEWLVLYGHKSDYLALMVMFENSFRKKQRRRKVLDCR